MQVDLRIQDKKDSGVPLFPNIAVTGYEEGKLESVGILEAGMESGEPSLWLNVKIGSGKFVCAQVSGAMFEFIAGALKGARSKWGDKNG